MTLEFEIVDEDLTTVLWDWNDPSGVNNPFRVKTRFAVGQTLDMGIPDLQTVMFEPSDAPGARTIKKREGLAEMVWKQRIMAISYESLRDGVARLAQLLERGGWMRWKPDDSVDAVFIHYEPSMTPAVFRGQDLDLFFVLNQLDTADGIELHIKRQPYLVGDELDSDLNKVHDGFMIYDPLAASSPYYWGWDNTGNISVEAIDEDFSAYAFNIATLSTRNFSQVLDAGTCAPGEIWSFSFWVRADVAARVSAAAVVRYLSSGGSNLGSEQLGVETSISGAWARLTVTTTAAPATTDTARVTVRFTNDSATSTRVYLRRAQAEIGSVSLFRGGTEDVYVNPYGKVPAPAAFNNDKSVVGGGNVNAGTHSYKITFVGPWGETEGSAASTVFTLGGASTVGLLSIPLGPQGTTQRKIYRTAAGNAAPWKLAVTVANNTATTASDNVADGSLGVSVPTTPIILGFGRVLPVYLYGEAETPVQFYLTADANGTVVQADFGLISDEGVDGLHSLTKYLNARKVINLVTATLSNDTLFSGSNDTYATIGEGANGGFAWCGFFDNPDVMKKRVSGVVTTDLNCLVGESWDLVLRGGPLDFSEYTVQLRWSPRSSGGAIYTLPAVTIDNQGGGGGDQFTEINLGRIAIPAGVEMSGFSYEIWASCDSAVDGVFAFSELFLYPTQVRSLLGAFPPGSGEVWKGHKLRTPITTPAAGATALVKHGALILKDDNDSGGTPPNSGRTLPLGVHEVSFTYNYSKQSQNVFHYPPDDPVDGMTVRLAVWDITSNVKVVGDTIHLGPNSDRSHKAGVLKLRFKVTDANKLYQFHAMVTDPGDLDDDGNPQSRCTVQLIKEHLVPSGTGAQVVHTDPERYVVEQLDTSNRLIAPFGVQGPVPARALAGLAMVHLGAMDVPLAGNNFPSSFTGRYVTVRTKYRPQYRG